MLYCCRIIKAILRKTTFLWKRTFFTDKFLHFSQNSPGQEVGNICSLVSIPYFCAYWHIIEGIAQKTTISFKMNLCYRSVSPLSAKNRPSQKVGNVVHWSVCYTARGNITKYNFFLENEPLLQISFSTFQQRTALVTRSATLFTGLLDILVSVLYWFPSYSDGHIKENRISILSISRMSHIDNIDISRPLKDPWYWYIDNFDITISHH